MSIILVLGFTFIAAAIVGKITNRFRLSSVTGYIISGVIIGLIFPSVRTLFTIDSLKVFDMFVISILAFMIGGELEISRLRSLPKGVLRLVVVQALVTFLLVAGAVLLSGQSIGFSMCLGAIGAASAPATTLMMVKKRNAKGEFVDTLLPLVALDDAITVILATVAIAFAMSTESLGSVIGAIGLSLWEILGALVIGAVTGIVLGYLIRYTKGGDELLFLVLGIVFLGTGIASMMRASTIITGLVSGATVANLVVGHRKLFSSLERFIPPFYVVIFTLAGILFEPSVFWSSIPLFLIYMVARTIGKIVGTKFGVTINKGDKKVANHLGIAILSQSGLAVALAIGVYGMIPEYSQLILSIMVPAVIAFECISPSLINFALDKAKDIDK